MKKFYLFLVALVAFNGALAQSCLPEGITFSSQAEIDNFQIDHPGCSEIEGNVTISGSDITNLNGLNVLTSIGGDFLIWSNSALTNLTGLENLSYIGGTLDVWSNGAMISFSGLEDLTSIGGPLFISGNASLTNLTGLDNVTSIGGFLHLSLNDNLTSLSGLQNVDSGSITDLTIFFNYSLSNCEAQSLCDYLANPNGIVTIFDNAPGCSSAPEVAAACGIPLSCLPVGNYYFHSQNEIDNFPANYPGCTELQGNVEIMGNDITNLNGLSDVTSIGGYLFIEWAFSLTSLAGLSSLTSIGDMLMISTTGLVSLAGLENLDAGSISYLVIANNSSLSTCDVRSICDYLTSPEGTVSIYNNAEGCNSQEEVLTRCAIPATVPISIWPLFFGGALIALSIYLRYRGII